MGQKVGLLYEKKVKKINFKGRKKIIIEKDFQSRWTKFSLNWFKSTPLATTNYR
jgi:hypothetical protein